MEVHSPYQSIKRSIRSRHLSRMDLFSISVWKDKLMHCIFDSATNYAKTFAVRLGILILSNCANNI